MSAKRIWPATPMELADRSRAVDLVRRVGRQRLRFSMQHLQQEMDTYPVLRLAKPKQLARHVHDLGPTLILPAERRFAAMPDPNRAEPGGAPQRAKHFFVLAERWREYENGHAEWDDLEKVLLALWVAFETQGAVAVPTRAVTEVLQNIEALAPETCEQTSLRLSRLAKRKNPLVEKSTAPGDRWSRWRPIGMSPTCPEYETWVSRMLSLYTTAGARPQGSATVGEAVREVVLLAIRATRTREWPVGHPVQIDDMRAVAASNLRAGALLSRIESGGRKLHEVLGDVTKTRISSGSRKELRVVRLPRQTAGRAYYDVPDDPGFERRGLYVLRDDLRGLMDHRELQGIAHEHLSAEGFMGASDAVVVAIGAVRLVHCWSEVETREWILRDLRNAGALLSKKTREALREPAGRLADLIRGWGTKAAAEERARAALAPFGLVLEEVLAADRPVLSGNEMREFLPERMRGEGTAAKFFARKTTLPRFPNPDFTHRHDPDPARAAVTTTDRAEAMVYLAESVGSRMLTLLRQGMRLLGRSMRSPELVQLLVRGGTREHQIAALGALVLLNDRASLEIAESWLGDPTTDVLRSEYALYATLAMKEVRPESWAGQIRATRNPSLRRTWMDVLKAAQQERWLLPR